MNHRKLVFITALGSGLEYFDFIVYGLLSTYLSVVFFPKHDAFLATLQTLFVFSLGYFARPFGGILFGWLGDHYGRKSGFLLSMFCIALSTFCIGLLPSYQTIGIAGTILLIFFRLIQGVAFGAELPGMTTFLCEHIQTKSKGLAFGLVLSGVSFGGALGTLLIYSISQVLSHAEMIQYGWRLPFLLGGSLAIVSYFLRKKLQESPLFLRHMNSVTNIKSIPLKVVLSTHYKQVVFGVLITLFGACYVIFGVTLPAFLHHIYHYSIQSIYWAISIGFIFSILLLPVFGYVSERLGRIKLLIMASLFMVATSFILFHLLAIHAPYALIIFIAFYQITISALANSYLPLLTELFPIGVRFTGVAICYNVAFLIASLTPAALMISAHLLNDEHKAYFMLLLLAAITMLAASFLVVSRKKCTYPIESAGLSSS